MPRRERAAIFGAILAAVEEASAAGRPVSSVATKANLPYDRMSAYLRELEAAGLVHRDGPPVLTPQGREMLESYRRWNQMLERFGLE